MVGVKFTGVEPLAFYKKARSELLAIINDEATNIESELVQATPGDRGGLRRGWTLKPATEKNLAALIGQNSVYFLPLELGRRPGKGISAEGQIEVAKWALRKKIISRKRNKQGQFLPSKEAANFAYLLSQKYKAVGRPAMGFAGLANPGDDAPSQLPANMQPKGGPILEGFNRLQSRLR